MILGTAHDLGNLLIVFPMISLSLFDLSRSFIIHASRHMGSAKVKIMAARFLSRIRTGTGAGNVVPIGNKFTPEFNSYGAKRHVSSKIKCECFFF